MGRERTEDITLQPRRGKSMQRLKWKKGQVALCLSLVSLACAVEDLAFKGLAKITVHESFELAWDHLAIEA